jgi:hypothetical protein
MTVRTQTDLVRPIVPIALAILTLLPATYAFAQSAEVTGEVKTPDEQPVVGVPVIVEGPEGKSVLFTDKEGRWTLYNAPAGDYSVQAIAPESGLPPKEGTESNTATVPFKIEEKGFFDHYGSTSVTSVKPLITDQWY